MPDAHAATKREPAAAELLARRRELLGRSYRLFYEEPFHPVRAQGVWLYDAGGEAYLDAYNNVPCVGHCHPSVVAAMADQAARLNTHTRYLHETILDYAEELLATLPGRIDRLTLTCTGSEANDLALRVANCVTGGSGIVVTDLAYHGGTVAVAGMSPSLGLGVADHVRTIAAPDAYRYGADGLGERFGADVAAAFADLDDHGHPPSALVFDTIFSSDGVLADPVGFLQPAVTAARDAGALVIADEVQAGFCRTGDAFWGFQRHGIEPDVVTMGKPMGAGYPVAGLASRAAVLDRFGEHSRYFNTFGGNPVSCAAGRAVLQVIREEGLLANAADTGGFLRAGLRELAGLHPLIGDVRGAGLFTGVELVGDRESKTHAGEAAGRMVDGLRRRKVLISRTGPGDSTLKIRPPLCFSREDAALFLARFEETLGDINP